MSEEARLRDEICFMAKSLFDRGLTAGSSGNISARLSDGRLLVTPTGSSFGRLDPAKLSCLEVDGRQVGGDEPTKEMPLLPYFMPGDPGMGDAIRGLAGRRSAVMLAAHGPVVAGKDLEAAVYAIEELEETAKLALLTRSANPSLLSPVQIGQILHTYDVEWD
ncbi:class II aldolase/adducin family protein [Rhizobium sp. ZK1]|uniref:class II aldolase/adducin family protein n=1 Tax=Rhizobium sp. ZK1 TaxID=3389872 RepID=UPI0039F72EFC